jgi:Tfp pilus assembly protein PilO
MAALTKAGRKERSARILSFLVLGALVATSTSYLIAPRFQTPVGIVEEANTSLGNKILVNERISLLTAQESRQGLAKAELLEMQEKFPSNTEVVSLEQAINTAISAAGLTPSALKTLVFETEFVPVADPLSAINPSAPVKTPAEGETATTEEQPIKMYAKGFSLSLIGSPLNLASFIDNLTQLKRVVIIDKFDITVDSAEGLNVLTITGRTFLMPDALASETDAVDLEEVNNIFDGEEAPAEENTTP